MAQAFSRLNINQRAVNMPVFSSVQGLAPHIPLPERPPFQVVQFFEELGRNGRSMKQALRLPVEDAELFWIERDRNHLTDLKLVVGDVKDCHELCIGGGQA